MPMPVTPVLTADAVIIAPFKGVVLIRRARAPYAGCWALPGGFVEVGEVCVDACLREAREETGLDVEAVELLGVYSAPDRDPRGHTVSAVYLCRVVGGSLSGGDDASEARWFDNLTGIDLAFDHAAVLTDACLIHRPLTEPGSLDRAA